jgi:hypothetical protein
MVEATGAEPLIDPETGWSRLMVERMVKSIHIASAISSWVWTTTIYQGRPILNIGNINFVSGGKNGAMYLLVDHEALKPGAVEMFEAFRTAGDLHSNPSFSWVDLPLDSTADALAVFADAHEAAIRKEAKKWKINQRWKWFQDEARQTISKVAGEDIPEPGYMQQLRELKSTDPLPPISGMYSQAMIEQMAASILAAHELGASCWSLFEAAKRIVLNVGQETVGGSNKAGTYDFVVDRELLTPEQDEWASVHLKPKPTDQYPSLLFLQLPDDTESDRLSDLQEAHISALTKLTKVFKKATLWKLHQEDFRIQIEQVSGLAIPQPGYLPPPSTRYWKMSPGANAVHWNQF